MVAYSWRVNSTLHFAHVSTRIRDFVSNVGVILLKPRGRAMPFRKLIEISICRNHQLCNLYALSALSRKIQKHRMEGTPKSRSVGIAHFLKHISIAIWLNSLEYIWRQLSEQLWTDYFNKLYFFHRDHKSPTT